jgi:hypothetical protein
MAQLLSRTYVLLLAASVALVLAHGSIPASAAPAGAAAAADQFQPCPFPGFEAAVQRFSKVLTFKTVSSADTEHHTVDPQEFDALDAYLAQAYAEVTHDSALRVKDSVC